VGGGSSGAIASETGIRPARRARRTGARPGRTAVRSRAAGAATPGELLAVIERGLQYVVQVPVAALLKTGTLSPGAVDPASRPVERERQNIATSAKAAARSHPARFAAISGLAKGGLINRIAHQGAAACADFTAIVLPPCPILVTAPASFMTNSLYLVITRLTAHKRARAIHGAAHPRGQPAARGGLNAAFEGRTCAPRPGGCGCDT
jgi:hypothetical protein